MAARDGSAGGRERVEGVEVAYRAWGHGRPGVMMIHGAGGSSLPLAELGRLVGRSRRVVAPDLPGHGRSAPFDPWPAPDALIDRYRDVVAALAERVGLGRFVLVGHSMGGAVALRLALTWPERLAGLVLVATGARLGVDPAIFQAIDGAFDRLPDLMGPTSFSPASDPARVAAWAREHVQAPQAVFHADFAACDGFDVRARLGEIAVPTVVVSGADDLLTPPRSQVRLAEGIAGARLVTLPRAGHVLYREHPRATAEAILSAAPAA